MPRMARKKYGDAIYHIMVKSISEVNLFEERMDKINYLKFMKEYQNRYHFKVYGYCLMVNHGHFIIDANGADISKIMHGINHRYAMKFNKIHKRKGHLFQERFKSIIVKSDKYLLTLSAYIHNNPMAIEEYKEHPEKYEFSSLAQYLGIQEYDPFELVDTSFILQFFGNLPKEAKQSYRKYVLKCDDEFFKKEVEFIDEETEYRSYRKILVRDFSTEDIIEFIIRKTEQRRDSIYIKNSRDSLETRALVAYFLRGFCNYSCVDLCDLFGNITQGRVSELCSIGVRLIFENKKYEKIVDEFFTEFVS